ncbi:shufflon protein C [Salmonella enterica]|nr:shufflon protein C [Salmonella enterica]EAS0933603.1 shufflon protein C [Salmonella enterica]EAT9249183.1 shufflon protein C [Salmonella enterica]EAV9263425.1 shufflon protein C [Salmonella enterica]EAW3307057.1 shufflon protein C [Salmonella enterica]
MVVRFHVRLLGNYLLNNCQSGAWKSFQNKFSIQAFDVGKNVTNRDIGIHAYCSWTNLNGSPFGGFQKVYADRSNRWFVTNTRWGDYESGGTITVTCLNLLGDGI